MALTGNYKCWGRLRSSCVWCPISRTSSSYRSSEMWGGWMPSSKSFQQTEDIQQIDIIHFNTTICILNTNTLIQFSVSAPDTTAPCEWLFLYPKRWCIKKICIRWIHKLMGQVINSVRREKVSLKHLISSFEKGGVTDLLYCRCISESNRTATDISYESC